MAAGFILKRLAEMAAVDKWLPATNSLEEQRARRTQLARR